MIDAQAPVETFNELDSTLLEARRRAEQGAYGPVWLIAKRQTMGRGHRGRTWLSFDGNLMTTYLNATPRTPSEIALYGFAAGLAIAETLEAMTGVAIALKWPNDVMMGDAKVAGIILESGAVAGGGHWASLSFGLNIAAAPKAIDQPTTSLREALPPDALAPAPEAVFAAIRLRLEAWAARFEQEGFAVLREAWLQRAYGLGGDVWIAAGAAPLTGRFAGLSVSGELELDTSDGRRLISAGDVYFSSAA